MPVRGVLFDLYGTLIDIETDESSDEVFETVATYLMYQGIYLEAAAVRESYWSVGEALRRESGETYPEVDVEAIWRTLLAERGMKAAQARHRLARTLAQLFRVLSRRHFRPFPGTAELLGALRAHRRLGVVSDAQICYALPEMKALGLDACFDTIVLSASYGFSKPDERLFGEALKRLGLQPGDVVHVGNDRERDVLGAHRSGIKAILVHAEGGKEVPEAPGYVARANRPVPMPMQGEKELLETPDYVARDLADVLKGIDKLSAVPLG